MNGATIEISEICFFSIIRWWCLHNCFWIQPLCSWSPNNIFNAVETLGVGHSAVSDTKLLIFQ